MTIAYPDERKIVSIATALEAGVTLEDIHDDMIKMGYTEYAVFLAVKAAENLNKSRKQD